MRRRWRIVALLVTAATLTGCGVIEDDMGQPAPLHAATPAEPTPDPPLPPQTTALPQHGSD